MGAERKSAVISAENAKCTAYHEAGHAVVSVLTEGSRPIHKATIVPRGNSLGMVTSLPESDETSMSWKQMIGENAFNDITNRTTLFSSTPPMTNYHNQHTWTCAWEVVSRKSWFSAKKI